MMKRIQATRILMFALSIGLLASVCPVQAEELPFFPVWIDGSGELSGEATDTHVQDFARANPDPEHIIVWIHGFATTRADSTQEYGILTKRLNKSFGKFGVKPAVIGIQWDSAVKMSLFKILGEYDNKTLLARKTGRMGARRFLLALQKRFPQAKISIMAHSMGCEVTMGANRPKVDFATNDTDRTAYEPKASLKLFVASLLGADLNFNIGAKSRLPLRSDGIKLLWLSEDSLYRHRDQDMVLRLRAFVSGKALGASFPLMTEEQYDGLFGHRAVVFDKQDIPRTHRFLLYYDQVRIEHIVRAILVKAGAAIEPPEELKEIDAVMDAPNEVEALVPFLDSHLFTGQIYALWRLEHLFGEGSSNFANGSLQAVAIDVYHRPKAIHNLRKDSPSPTVRKGLWPSEEGLARSGAPKWATLAGYGWTKSFRGEVVNIEDDVIYLLTTFGDHRSFDLRETTLFTPSRGGLRIGSKVELEGALKQARSVKVIPLHTWIREGYGKTTVFSE